MNTSRALRGIWKDHMKPIKRHLEGIKQAKAKHNTWLPASIQGPLTRLTRDSYIRTGELVGTDSRGSFIRVFLPYCLQETLTTLITIIRFQDNDGSFLLKILGRNDGTLTHLMFLLNGTGTFWHNLHLSHHFRWLAYMTDDPPTAYGVPPTPR